MVISFQSRGPSKPELLVDARRSHKSSKRSLENGINGKKRKSEKRRARVSDFKLHSSFEIVVRLNRMSM